MDFWNNNVKFFNSLGDTVNGLNTGVKQIWEQGSHVIISLDALKAQIDSLTQYLQLMQTVAIILCVLIVVQFFFIMWILAGQSELKKKLIKLEEFFLDREVKHGQQSNSG